MLAESLAWGAEPEGRAPFPSGELGGELDLCPSCSPPPRCVALERLLCLSVPLDEGPRQGPTFIQLITVAPGQPKWGLASATETWVRVPASEPPDCDLGQVV